MESPKSFSGRDYASQAYPAYWEAFKMRIVHVNHTSAEFGTYWRCLFLSQQLVRTGHEVTVLCNSRTGFHDEKRNGVRVVQLPRTRRKEGYFRTKLVLKLKPDLVHAFSVSQFSTGIPAVLARLLGYPVVVDWDDWFIGFGAFAEATRPLNRLRLVMEEKIPTIASAVTVVSEALFKRALRCGVDMSRLFLVTNGADIDFIKPIPCDEARRRLTLDPAVGLAVYVGYLWTGISLLLRAFKTASSEMNGVKLIVVGNVSESHMKLASRLGIDQKVLFAGSRPRSEVPLWLSAADFLVMPMEDNLIERSRWPIRLGDYLASGRAIVANDVGEAGRVIRENGCGLVATPSPEDLAAKMLNLFRDSSLKSELGVRARETAIRYSWSAQAAKLEKIYRSVAG